VGADVRSIARLGALALAALVALVFARLGTAERDRAVASQREGIERVRALVGPLDGPRLTGMRSALQPTARSCFLYRAGAQPSGYELCWDADGGLVEALDRSRGESELRIWSLLWRPEAAPLHTSGEALERLSAHVQARLARIAASVGGLNYVLQQIDALDGIALSGHSATGGSTCLSYGPAAYEVCFDRRGRLVSAVERSRRRTVWSIASSPWSTPLRIAPADLRRYVRLVPVRRAEADVQRAAIRRVRDRVGPLASSRLTGFEKSGGQWCFSYRAGGLRRAYELCWTPTGDLITALDRRGQGPVRGWTLGELPERPAAHVRPSLLKALRARLS
jgi:hypothetical protein